LLLKPLQVAVEALHVRLLDVAERVRLLWVQPGDLAAGVGAQQLAAITYGRPVV
jgi:hypothetical protein